MRLTNKILSILNVILFIGLIYRHVSITDIISNEPTLDVTNDVNIEESRRLQETLNVTNETEYIRAFHPLNPFSSDEFTLAVNIAKTRFRIPLSDRTRFRIHSYAIKFPEKSMVQKYLYDNNGELSETDFNRIIDMDISILQRIGYRRRFYNITVDITNQRVIDIDVVSAGRTGFPQMIGADADVSSTAIMNNTDILDYFVLTLNIPPDALENIECTISSPFPDYFISILQGRVQGIEVMFYFDRMAVAACFDVTFYIENRYKNHIPFLALINLDESNIVYWWKCDDIEMNMDCITASDFYMEFYWTNKINVTELIDGVGIAFDEFNECVQDRAFGEEPIRPRMRIVSDDDRPTWDVTDHVITWQEWSFHEQLMYREGPRLADIRFKNRSIIYDMMLSDMYVPYHDLNNIQFYAKGFLDIGHYGAGLTSTTALPLNTSECPDESLYLTQEIMTSSGAVVMSPIYACVFERWDGEPRVRHGGEIPNTARNIELVYRTVYTIGNYDYLVSYEFRLDGSIKVKTGATGYNLVSQVDPIYTNSKQDQYTYCNLLSNHYCSPFHDHFFGFRIDIDVDEPINNFYRGSVSNIKQSVPPGRRFENTRLNERNAFTYIENIVSFEQDSASTKDPRNPNLWVFRSTSNQFYNQNIRYHTGYEILPAMQNILLWNPETDVRDHMATWTQHGMFVTKYNPNELYISGRYTWQSRPRQGLFEYMSNNDNIINEDLVAWINIGFHHVTRADDIPAAHMMYNEFLIKPFNFFVNSQSVCGNDIE